MLLKLTVEETSFMEYMLSERRNQLNAVRNLWGRHHRQDAKRIIDCFPYEKGDLIPYIQVTETHGLLRWDPSTHNDLVSDMRDHLTELQQEESHNKKNHPVPIVHGLLKKLEAMTEDARSEDEE